jgi:hypothetical protein
MSMLISMPDHSWTPEKRLGLGRRPGPEAGVDVTRRSRPSRMDSTMNQIYPLAMMAGNVNVPLIRSCETVI